MADNDLTINDLITLNESGLQVADYADIVKVLLQRYKQIYGADIDVDPRTGDGRFIYDVATIINTGLAIINQMYTQLNPNTASGNFLDIICSFTNVQRRAATYSYASIELSNSSNQSVSIDFSNDTYKYIIDESGNEWVYAGTYTNVTIESNKSITDIWRCLDIGPVKTTYFKWEIVAGNNPVIDLNLVNLSIGQERETDQELRARRERYSNNGITVLASLQAALLNVSGVKDVYIQSYAGNPGEEKCFYYNNESFEQTVHSVSILIRESNVNKPSLTSIGEAIRNYLTPGITTCQKSLDGTEYPYEEDEIYNRVTQVGTLTRYFWKKVPSVHPTLTIKLKIYNNFSGSQAVQSIATQLIDYLNNLRINQNVLYSDLLNVIQLADPTYNGTSTYAARSVSSDNDYINPTDQSINTNGLCYNYGSLLNIDFEVSEGSTEEGLYTFTISKKES